MKRIVPKTHYVMSDGNHYRVKVFSETAEWQMGDLLDIAGRPSIFLRIVLYDKEFLHLGSNKWEGAGGFVAIADESGIREMSADEFAEASDDIRLVTRFRDVA